ncbi:hypothetical protein EXIGLDRAFT_832542 [Exidia glandulosa HHB12029]|uniref:F-box domain-containing protein n=1 Tax=Exidia glandulosa HHB12029 TaxID=1314781 RepID=A0A165LJI7_EXIGL|nr:hypothetical protein EXIGLDRAFT_832542 [Exidia glandulosa HHB12029]
MSVALARAPSLEDAMMVDSWRPSSPERQRRVAEWYPPTSPSMATSTTMETPATPERESKRRCIANNYSPSAGARAAMWQPQPPIPAPPVLAPASSLPDELLIYILTSTKWSPCDLASAARVCRRWLPAATQVLYSSLFLCTEGTDRASRTSHLAQTMWNAPYLRALVRRLDLIIGTESCVDVESLLGWTALIPPEPGLRALSLWTNDDTGGYASVLLRAPALRAVRDLGLRGPGTISLLSVPRRIERLSLDLHHVGDVTLPSLPHLRSLSLAALRVTVPHQVKYEQLQTLELSHMGPTHACEIVERLSRWPNLHTLSLSLDWIGVLMPHFGGHIMLSLTSSSLTILRVDLHTATRLSSLDGTKIEELHVRACRHQGDDVRALSPVFRGGKLKVVRLVGVKPEEDLRMYIRSLGVERVEFDPY